MTVHSTTLQTAIATTIRKLRVSEQGLFATHPDQLDPVSRVMGFGGADMASVKPAR